MDIFEGVKETLVDILDIDEYNVIITPGSYLVRNLEAESIDMLEIVVSLGTKFKVEVKDEDIFLRSLHFTVSQARNEGKELSGVLNETCPWLSAERIDEKRDRRRGGRYCSGYDG